MEIKSTLAINASGLVAVSSGGILRNSGSSTITATAATLTFASGAKFQHAVTTSTGTVPAAGWNANSTLEIMNTAQIGGTPPSGLAQSFGNVTWDNNQSSGCNLVGVNLNSIAGTFTVKNTGSFDLRLGSTHSPTENWGNLVLQGGTLTTASSSGVPTMNVAGSVTFSGGALTIVNAAPLNVGGNWTKNSGTFTPGTGTVTLNGGSAQAIGGSAATTFNSLALNNSAGATLITGPTVNGTLTLTTGSLNSAANLTLGSGATISRNTGTLDAAPTFGTTVNVSYTGASAANTDYEIPASSTVLSNLTVNKSGGVTLVASPTVNGTLTLTSGSFDVGANTLTLNGPTIAGTPANLTTTSGSTLVFGGSSSGVNVPSSVTSLSGLTINNANDVSLNSSPTVAGTLTLTSGKVQAGANTLSVSSAGAISGGSSSSYVNGALQKAFNTGSGQSFSFPIGDATVYAPVALTNLDVTGADTLTATTAASQHPQIGTSGIDPTKDVQRYWTLTPGGGLTVSTYDAMFNFDAADVIGGATPASFIVERYSGGTWFTNTLGTLTSTSSQATGLSAFGDFAVGEAVGGGGGPTPTGSTIASVSLAGNLLSLTITNGLTNGVFILIESTNVLFSPFTTNQSGTFDGSGNASVTVTNTGGNNFLRVAEPTP
jgi:hypothetical protein